MGWPGVGSTFIGITASGSIEPTGMPPTSLVNSVPSEGISRVTIQAPLFSVAMPVVVIRLPIACSQFAFVASGVVAGAPAATAAVEGNSICGAPPTTSAKVRSAVAAASEALVRRSDRATLAQTL